MGYLKHREIRAGHAFVLAMHLCFSQQADVQKLNALLHGDSDREKSFACCVSVMQLLTPRQRDNQDGNPKQGTG